MNTFRLNKFGIAVVTALILAIGASTFLYFKSRKLEQIQQAPVIESKKLVDEVSKLIMLPQGEDPTIATVSDSEKVKDQPFFANAKVGDKVLIYTKARKAYLYDPVAKILIEVTNLNIGDSSISNTTQ